MENLLGTFFTFLLLYKYVAIFLISYAAALILPLPSGTTIAAAGAFAVEGYFSFWGVVTVALLGNIMGDATGYFIARRYGILLLTHIGFTGALRSKQYLFVEKYLRESPYALIFFSRFFAQANALVNILAGIGKIPLQVFFLFEVFGEIAFVFFYTYAGFLLGAQLEENLGFISDGASLVILLGLIVLTLQVILRRKRK